MNSALTWSLARILRAPEPRRIYVGSFWDQPLQPSYMGALNARPSSSSCLLFLLLLLSSSSLRLLSPYLNPQLLAISPLPSLALFAAELFEKESHALLADLASAPRNNTTSKLNDLVYRTRMVRVQALIFHELRSAMPKMTGKDKKQKEVRRARD